MTKITGSSLIRAAMLLMLLTSTHSAHADLPLTVEDIITDAGRFKLDVTLTYANSERQGLARGEPILIQVGPTSFISLPSAIGESQRNTDSIVGTLGMRYGVSEKAEFYARGSYLYNMHRSYDEIRTSSSSESRFADAWIGLNYQFKGDDDTPAVLGFGEIAAREKHSESSVSFKSAMFGVTAYKALDPVVFSLTGAYRVNRTRNNGSSEYKPGNLLLLHPSFAFAANDRVTLTAGLQWTSRQPDRIAERDQGLRRTSTDFLLGVAYGIAQGSALNVTFKGNASGRNGADLRINLLQVL